MSRSNPNDRIPNPAKRFCEWNGETGRPRYYDKELKENVELSMPFEFILLDRLSTITGWHNATEAGIYSNEVRDTRDEPLIVRSFKMADPIAEGFYADIKDKIKANGGKFTINAYIAYAEEVGKLALGSFKMHGIAMSAWFDFENNKENRPFLYKKGIRIASTLHGEKGSRKKKVKVKGEWVEIEEKIEWEAPVFEFYDLEEDEQIAAIGIDTDILQPYLKNYFARTRKEQAEPEDEKLKELQEAKADESEQEIPF